MNNLVLINNHMELPYLDDVITVAYTNTLTDETKRTYLSTILEFFNVSDLNDISVANIRSITPEIATTWAHQLIKNGLAIATVNKKLSSLQSFYKFLCRRNIGIMSYNPFSTDEGCIRFKGTAKNYSPRTSLTQEQTERIVSVIPQDGFKSFQDEIVAKRDYLVMAILITAGLRRSELCSIKVGDIREIQGQHIVEVLGKGNKMRMMVLAGSIKGRVDEYLEMRGLDYDDVDAALITGHSSNSREDAHVSDKTIERIVKKYAIMADIDPALVSPHVLRHTFCTELLRMGHNIVDVSDLMGHTNIATTRRYDHINRTLESAGSNQLAERFSI